MSTPLPNWVDELGLRMAPDAIYLTRDGSHYGYICVPYALSTMGFGSHFSTLSHSWIPLFKSTEQNRKEAERCWPDTPVIDWTFVGSPVRRYKITVRRKELI